MIGPDTQVNPEVAYGIAKYAAGKMAFIECESLQMECIWTRTFSVYGINDNRTTMVMYAIDKLLKGENRFYEGGTNLGLSLQQGCRQSVLPDWGKRNQRKNLLHREG